MSAEAALWLALAGFAASGETWKLACLVVVPLTDSYCSSLAAPAERRDGTRRASIWRQPKQSARHLDAQGTFAGTILVPVLLSAMSKQISSGADQQHLEGLALSALTLMFDFKAASWTQRIPDAVRLALAVVLISSHKLKWNGSILLSVGILYASYYAIRLVPSLHGVFTKGEWKIVSSLTATAVSVWLLSSVRHGYGGARIAHNEVAFVGVATCLATCAVLGLRPIKSLPFTAKIACLTCIPLMSIEVIFASQSSHLSFPRSIVWLVGFLLEDEDSSQSSHSENSTWMRRIEGFPRYYWLVYWMAVLAITLLPAIAAPKSSFSDERRTIVARKWFHLIAVLLFAPVTLAAPQLQSLSYAIALAVLMVLESIRSQIPALNDFYFRYLDPVKDERGEHIVVSHMALVVGCAVPLWIAEYCSWPPSSVVVKAFVSLWGVLCLGIGDAMGAVVGIFFGRHRWSASNPRTIEGSLAMFLSVAVASSLVLNDFMTGVPVAAFAAILEAWTIQLDNLILPLAGSAVVVLLHQHSSI